MENLSWSYMPCETVEQILLYVPSADMIYNIPWVCKAWTNIISQPSFWIRKLRKIGITINEEIQSVLKGFERNVQVALLYHACLNEEKTILNTKNNKLKLPIELPLGYNWDIPISDDFSEMLQVAGNLVTRPAMWVQLNLTKRVIPVLPILLKLLAARESQVTVRDHYSFWNFSPRNFQMLKGPNGVANIRMFVGCVSTLEGLYQNASDMKIAIAVDKDNIAIDPGLCNAERQISSIYIKAGTDVSRITRLTSELYSIIVSGLKLTHIKWMADALKSLTPSEGFDTLVLHSFKFNKNELEELLRGFEKSKVRPMSIICASSILNADDIRQLNDLAAELNIIPQWRGKQLFLCYQSEQKLIDSEIYIM